MATRTQTFGAGKRESHDASDFYARFTPPKISDDETINPCGAADQLICGDAARHGARSPTIRSRWW